MAQHGKAPASRRNEAKCAGQKRGGMFTSNRTSCSLRFLLLFTVIATTVYAQQSPWGTAVTRLANEFTGPIARGFSLVAMVVGGLTMAFSDGSSRRTIGGLVFGVGLCIAAPAMLTFLFA